MDISDKIRALASDAEAALGAQFRRIDGISRLCTERILDIYREERVGEGMFAASTGYGYGDRGRDAIDRIAARVLGGEAGFMRPSILSGTHAITVGLFGLLRPGDTMLSVTGAPYDTLRGVIGMDGADGSGSLSDFGIKYREIPLSSDGTVDLGAIRAALADNDGHIRVVFLQRSKGYMDRRTLTAAEIGAAAALVHEISDAFVVVDNCYGEFTEEAEPAALGADLMIGSLIKNPGGGMADCGGYLVGKAEAVALAASRLTCPGVGLEVGASLGQNRNLLRGLFLAPHTTAQALKTAHLAAYIFSALGFKVNPPANEARSDIIQTVTLGSAELLCAFCRGIQSASPVDAYVTPEAWDMPGYDDPVIMAAGAFVGGSSIELSADGPMREPYIAFMQGGITYESARLGVMAAAEQVQRKLSEKSV